MILILLRNAKEIKFPFIRSSLQYLFWVYCLQHSWKIFTHTSLQWPMFNYEVFKQLHAQGKTSRACLRCYEVITQTLNNNCFETPRCEACKMTAITWWHHPEQDWWKRSETSGQQKGKSALPQVFETVIFPHWE